ncbi:MAG: accessory factor UbiK family protein [Rhodospirillales bacterium]
MQTRSRVFDDFAKVAGGAVSTLAGVKAEIEALVRQQIERFLVDADMVPRDEFDAVKAVAARARAEQEALETRVRALEKALGVKAPKRARKTVAEQKRAATRKAAKKARKPKRAATRKAAKKARKPAPRRIRKPATKRKPAKR